MAVSCVLSVAALQAQCNAVADLVDAGTGTAHGHLDIHSAAHTVLASISLANPAFGAASSASPSVAVPASLPIAFTGAADGTATHAHLVDRDATVIATLSVGTTDASVIVDNVVIATSQVGSLTALSISQPNGT
jgi:hypothetical protein